MDQWLALLILGDLDPYTPTITPRVSLPTRSTKSQLETELAIHRRASDLLSQVVPPQGGSKPSQ